MSLSSHKYMNKRQALLGFMLIMMITQQWSLFAQEISPVFEPIPAYLATPAPGHIYEIPVVIMRIFTDGRWKKFRCLHGSGIIGASVRFPWRALKERIDAFDKRIKFMLEEGSRFRGYKTPSAAPSIGYRVVAYITVYEQTPRGPVIGEVNGFPIYAPDFYQIFERFDMAHYVNSLGVKEIWVWMGGVAPDFPSYDPRLHKPENFRNWWESNMSSPLTGDISNSNRDNTDLPVYNSTYTVYGQNFRRTQAEAVHNHGHQLEAILSHVNHLQHGNTDLFWKKFVGQDENEDFITRACGLDTHAPRIQPKHYDTQNPARVESDIEDWTPDNNGSKKVVNVDTWGNLTYQCARREPC